METPTKNDRVRPWLYWLLMAAVLSLGALEISGLKSMNRLRTENSALRTQVADLQFVHARNTELEAIREQLLRSLGSQSIEMQALRDDIAHVREKTNQLGALRIQRSQAYAIALLEERVFTLQSELAAKPALPRFGGWVGVSIRDAKAAEGDTAPATGAVIMDIVHESPADSANLQKGDRVVAVDGEVITSAHDFKRAMSQKTGGQILTIDIIRKDTLRTVSVLPRDWPQ